MLVAASAALAPEITTVLAIAGPALRQVRIDPAVAVRTSETAGE
jgi:hypothetical protein